MMKGGLVSTGDKIEPRLAAEAASKAAGLEQQEQP